MGICINEILKKVKRLDKINTVVKKELPPFSLVKSDDDENHRISIEEYRQTQFTEEEDWNNIYNPKRCSIEALNYIEIKKRGEGAVKKTYKSFADIDESPYYDPIGVHLCIWKSNKCINNFICEQAPNSKNIHFSEYKDGIYCAICHIKKEQREFNWSKIGNCKRPNHDLKELDLNYEDKMPKTSNVEPIIKKRISRGIPNWEKLMIKCIHAVYNDKIVYSMSPKHSILLWPWQMTYYQKFKHSNPGYKDSHIFMRSEMENFRGDYGVIN